MTCAEFVARHEFASNERGDIDTKEARLHRWASFLSIFGTIMLLQDVIAYASISHVLVSVSKSARSRRAGPHFERGSPLRFCSLVPKFWKIKLCELRDWQVLRGTRRVQTSCKQIVKSRTIGQLEIDRVTDRAPRPIFSYSYYVTWIVCRAFINAGEFSSSSFFILRVTSYRDKNNRIDSRSKYMEYRYFVLTFTLIRYKNCDDSRGKLLWNVFMKRGVMRGIQQVGQCYGVSKWFTRTGTIRFLNFRYATAVKLQGVK